MSNLNIVSVPFKCLNTGNNTTSVELNINKEFRVVYTYIVGKIILDLEVIPNHIQSIDIYDYNLNLVNKDTSELFKTFCDSIQFPAFYFKICYNEHNNYDNYNTNNYNPQALTERLVQQNDPN